MTFNPPTQGGAVRKFLLALSCMTVLGAAAAIASASTGALPNIGTPK
jgi:hypothetical protein